MSEAPLSSQLTSRVFVTGGTGSLGRALIRRLLSLPGIQRVCSYARCEVRAAQLQEEFDHPALRVFVGDVRDQERLEEVIPGCNTVIHAAALKRLDAGSYHPEELVKTNILGTLNVIRAALHSGVQRVIVISSDKATMAFNDYGSTKRLAESCAISKNLAYDRRGMLVSAVRYGNVLASRGSVVHLWREAIRAKNIAQITKREATRFWMTLNDAVDLVLDAVRFMRGGEIFIPKLRAMRVADLLTALSPLSIGWPIIETGFRAGGEKCHEYLLDEREAERAVFAHDRIIIPAEHYAPQNGQWPGEPLPEAFVYSSNIAPFGWLSVQEMRIHLEGLYDERDQRPH